VKIQNEECKMQNDGIAAIGIVQILHFALCILHSLRPESCPLRPIP
jgi:hypothetical protein